MMGRGGVETHKTRAYNADDSLVSVGDGSGCGGCGDEVVVVFSFSGREKTHVFITLGLGEAVNNELLWRSGLGRAEKITRVLGEITRPLYIPGSNFQSGEFALRCQGRLTPSSPFFVLFLASGLTHSAWEQKCHATNPS